MPRKSIGPHLWHDQARDEWVIIDRKTKRRTGCAGASREGAEKALAEYIGARHEVAASPVPLIDDVLTHYLKHHAPTTASPEIISYRADSLGEWWGERTVDQITTETCRAYAAHRQVVNQRKAIDRAIKNEIKLALREKREPDLEDAEDNAFDEHLGLFGAREDLSVLRAALGYWHREKHALRVLPTVWLPQKADARSEWMTRGEIARLLFHSRKASHNLEPDPKKRARLVRHLSRFILIAYYTGSRSGVVRGLRYSMINFDTYFVQRKPTNARRSKKQAPPLRLPIRLRTWLLRWRRIDGDFADYVVHIDRLPIGSVKRSWNTARLAAGLPEEITRHTLRHSRATHLMRNKAVEDHDAAEFLGMTVQTFRNTYGHHDPEWQKEAADAR